MRQKWLTGFYNNNKKESKRLETYVCYFKGYWTS